MRLFQNFGPHPTGTEYQYAPPRLASISKAGSRMQHLRTDVQVPAWILLENQTVGMVVSRRQVINRNVRRNSFSLAREDIVVVKKSRANDLADDTIARSIELTKGCQH